MARSKSMLDRFSTTISWHRIRFNSAPRAIFFCVDGVVMVVIARRKKGRSFLSVFAVTSEDKTANGQVGSILERKISKHCCSSSADRSKGLLGDPGAELGFSFPDAPLSPSCISCSWRPASEAALALVSVRGVTTRQTASGAAGLLLDPSAACTSSVASCTTFCKAVRDPGALVTFWRRETRVSILPSSFATVELLLEPLWALRRRIVSEGVQGRFKRKHLQYALKSITMYPFTKKKKKPPRMQKYSPFTPVAVVAQNTLALGLEALHAGSAVRRRLTSTSWEA